MQNRGASAGVQGTESDLNYTTEIGPLGRLRDGLAFRVRRRMFDLFMREVAPQPDWKVADLGASGYRGHPVHQFIERLYPHRQNLTVLARAEEKAGWYPEEFPGVSFVECDLRSIPLPDRYFDAGICNAVVEYAGTRDQQVKLIHEVCRICRRVMLTTPNKWFPVELHTFLPFAHWLPDALYRPILRGVGHKFLAKVENLNLLSAKDFLPMFPASRKNRLVKVGLAGLSTNLIYISTDE